MKDIFVIISRTHTKFGSIVRLFSNSQFNHAAIALDEKLLHWYSFARKKRVNVLSAGMVRENLARYVMYQGAVNCKIFKIPVTEEQYEKISSYITSVYYDKEYIYNYPSILTYPVLKGIACYKTFTCVEFVSYLLEKIDIPICKERTKISPDELAHDLQLYLYYQGDLAQYVCQKRKVHTDKDYFRHFSLSDAIQCIHVVRMTKQRIL